MEADSTATPVAGQTVGGLLATAAAARPSAPALLAAPRPPMTYGRLAQQTELLSCQLRALGVAVGDGVAIVLPNGPEMAAAFLAVVASAVAAPLNPAYRQSEFDFYLGDLDARILLTIGGIAAPAVAAARARNIPVVNLAVDAAGPAGSITLSGPAAPIARRPRPADTALMLHTSGTTSRPKMVPLTHANLCASACDIRQWLELAPADRCLNVMPLFHIHGLAAALLASLAAGGSIACTPGFVATEFFDWLRDYRPTWYSAVPTMHQAVVARAKADPSIRPAAGLRFVRSASSALPPQLAADLEQLFGVPVIEAYGMTEASHQMCSNPLPPRPRRFGSVGVAVGAQVAVMDNQGNLLASDQVGEVVIRGPSVTSGYAANLQANADAFAHGWFRTGDLGRLDADGYLYLVGRIKEMINRGGEKISPREIDEVLLDHPAVAAAVTFAMPDPRLGEEVAAAIVLRPGGAATGDELMRFAAGRLADFKIPRRIVMVDEIPKGPTGKPQRIGLAAALGLVPCPALVVPARSAVPLTHAQSALADLWSQVLKVPTVSADANFVAMGGDSVLAAQVMARVRQRMGRELSVVAFFSAPTLAEMAAAVERAPSVDVSADPEPAGLPDILQAIEAMSEEEARQLITAGAAPDGLAASIQT